MTESLVDKIRLTVCNGGFIYYTRSSCSIGKHGKVGRFKNINHTNSLKQEQKSIAELERL